MVIGVESDSDEDRVLRSPNPILVWNAEGSAESNPMLRDRGVTDGVLARIQGQHGPWGLLGVYSTERVSLTEVDVHFVRAVANALATAIMYKRAQSTLDNLIADSSDPVARFDRDLRVEYANAAMVAATGCSSDKLVGRTFRALGLMDAQLDGLEAIVGAVLRSGREREAAFSLTTPLGARHYSVRFVPELATDRSVSSVLAMARDVTEHKRVDEERAFLQQELVSRDTRHEDFVQLLTEQQRTNVQEATASYRSEIISQLTSREREILRLLTGGLTNRQIARRLHLSAGTVKNHLGRVFPKLDAIDRTQAAVRAIELGLVATQEA